MRAEGRLRVRLTCPQHLPSLLLVMLADEDATTSVRSA